MRSALLFWACWMAMTIAGFRVVKLYRRIRARINDWYDWERAIVGALGMGVLTGIGWLIWALWEGEARPNPIATSDTRPSASIQVSPPGVLETSPADYLNSVSIIGRLPVDDATVFPLLIEVRTGVELRAVSFGVEAERIVIGGILITNHTSSYRGYEETIAPNLNQPPPIFRYEPSVIQVERGRMTPVSEARLRFSMEFAVLGYPGRHRVTGIFVLSGGITQARRWDVAELVRVSMPSTP